jgi:hypothetical protein
VAFRFIHTADWQVGKPFGNVAGRFGGRAADPAHPHRAAHRRARGRARGRCRARRGRRLRQQRGVRADHPAHRGGAEALRGPLGLPARQPRCGLAHSVWTRARGLGLPPNIVIADRPEPLAWAAPRSCPPPCGGGARTATRPTGSTPPPRPRGAAASAWPMAASPTACRARATPPTRSGTIGRSARGSATWRSATGTAPCRSRRAPGMRARPSPTATRPTVRAMCMSWAWTVPARPSGSRRSPWATTPGCSSRSSSWAAATRRWRRWKASRTIPGPASSRSTSRVA